MSNTTTRALLLPRARPSDVGVDAGAIARFLDALQDKGVELHSLMVLRHGSVCAEGWWSPYGPDRVHLLYSLSKSFTSTAVGFAVAEGRFALDDTVVSLLPEHVPDEVADSVMSLTVHHLLSMSTGHSEDTLDRMIRLEPHDPVCGFLRIPPQEPVGSRHVYNNGTTYVLAAIVEKATGERLLDYLRPRLFDPLGIDAARWDVDESGQAMGFSGLHLQTESIAAFGQLLLQDGVWMGERVLPDGWVALATRKHIDNDNDPAGNIDWRQGYGYQYWRSRHGFRGDGAFGQFCVVVPELDLVVATTALTPDMQVVLDAVWEQLLPGVSDGSTGPSDPEVEDALTARLAAAALPVVAAGTGSSPSGPRTFEVEDGGRDAPFAAGTRVTVRPGGPGNADTVISVELAEHRLRIGCGALHWTQSSLPGSAPVGGEAPRPAGGGLEVVCRGGWTGPETFEADLVLIETPHRIRLHASGSRCQARWIFPPLSGARIEAHLPV